MTQHESDKIVTLLNLTTEELTPAEQATLWLMLGDKLASEDIQKLSEYFAAYILKHYNETKEYTELAKFLANTVGGVALAHITETHHTRKIFAGKTKPNPLIMSTAIGEA